MTRAWPFLQRFTSAGVATTKSTGAPAPWRLLYILILQVPPVGVVLDNEQVDVALSVHVPSGSGPEQDDSLRLGPFYDPADDVIQN